MEARDYFSTMQNEVKNWKEKASDVIGRFDHVPPEEMEKLRPFLDELKVAIEDHVERLEELSTFCPSDVRSPKLKRQRFAWLREFWEEVGRYQQHRPPHL